ncbi:MAG TPA: glycosyltransferase [Methylocystis sp.]|nr:glycosyltransferase [Methylocystis sp.]
MTTEAPSALRFSAVICTYNRYGLLTKAVDSLLEQDADPGQFEILVVDNSPPGAERDSWREHYGRNPRIRYVTVDRPGLANARNVAVKEARGEIVGFLDDDAIASPGWTRAYLRAFDAFGAEAQIAGGAIAPLFEAPRPDWLHDKLLVYFTVIHWGDSTRFLSKEQWVAGANIAYRKSAYEAAGGCNTSLGRVGAEATLMSNEETELVERIEANGGRTLYAPDARVEHLVPANRMTRAWLRRRVLWQAISDMIAGKKDRAPREQRERELMDYIAHVPARERSLRAFFFDAQDPELFYWQLQALYTLEGLIAETGELFPESD